jgi:hypothetical protein
VGYSDQVLGARFHYPARSLERLVLGSLFRSCSDAKPYGRLGQVHNSHLLIL